MSGPFAKDTTEQAARREEEEMTAMKGVSVTLKGYRVKL